MLRIAPNGYQPQQYSQKPAFKGKPKVISNAELRECLQAPISLEKKSARLIEKMRNMINETRAELRKKGIFPVEPQYNVYSPKDGIVTLKPMANSRNNGFMLEMDKGKGVERILVDKDMDNKIVYEYAKKTDYGTAVTKRYEVQGGADKDLTERIHETLNKYIVHFINQKEKEKMSRYLR